MGYDTFALRMKMTGGSSKQEQIKNARLYTEMLLPDDPSYKESVEILGKGALNLRMNNYKIVQGTTPQMDIQASLSENITFNLGDVFFYDDGYWLCVEANEFHDIYKQGKVEECNYLLKWQNPKTYEIVERWCSVRDPYASGLDEGNTITVGNGRYKIKLPHDKETELFYVDKRFLIDIANNEPIPYSIVKYDSVTNRYAARNEGFLVINLKQSELQEDDNWDLMVANYQPEPLPPTPSIGSCKIVFSGQPTLKVGGSIKLFTAVFYDSDEELITTLTPIWELIMPPELESLNQIKIASEIGNEIGIRALQGDESIGMTFTLKVFCDDSTGYGYFEATQEIEITELF